jgi:transcriptional regulator with XRE-family HTH domain
MTTRVKIKTPSEEQARRRLGERLRQAREYLNLSQDDVAKYLSVQRTALSNIEAGQRRVDAIELKRLADLYKRPLSHFTDDDEDSAGLPSDVTHLARAAAQLSVKDREELSRFAEYLRARSKAEGGKR